MDADRNAVGVDGGTGEEGLDQDRDLQRGEGGRDERGRRENLNVFLANTSPSAFLNGADGPGADPDSEDGVLDGHWPGILVLGESDWDGLVETSSVEAYAGVRT